MGKKSYDNAYLRWVTMNTKQGNYMSNKMIANGKARQCVDDLRPFRGSNLWGEWYEQGIDGTNDIVRRYVVYSYRYTFPLYVYDEVADQWYENDTQFSQTTSRHRTQCRPTWGKPIKMCVSDMEVVARKGSVGLIEREVA